MAIGPNGSISDIIQRESVGVIELEFERSAFDSFEFELDPGFLFGLKLDFLGIDERIVPVERCGAFDGLRTVLDHPSKGRDGSWVGLGFLCLGTLDSEAQDPCVGGVGLTDGYILDFELTEFGFVEFPDGTIAQEVDGCWDGVGNLNIDVVFKAHASGVG